MLPVGALTLTGCNTDWIATAEKDVPVAGSILESVLGIVAAATGNPALLAADAVVIQTAVGIVEADLKTLQALIAGYNASPSASIFSKIDSALEDASSHLGGILAAVFIKDIDLQSSISAGINGVIALLNTIQLLIPSSTASVKLKKAGVTVPTPSLITPQQLKANFNAVVTVHGYAAYTVK